MLIENELGDLLEVTSSDESDLGFNLLSVGMQRLKFWNADGGSLENTSSVLLERERGLIFCMHDRGFILFW